MKFATILSKPQTHSDFFILSNIFLAHYEYSMEMFEKNPIQIAWWITSSLEIVFDFFYTEYSREWLYYDKGRKKNRSNT